jgi:hypothetical protein
LSRVDLHVTIVVSRLSVMRILLHAPALNR